MKITKKKLTQTGERLQKVSVPKRRNINLTIKNNTIDEFLSALNNYGIRPEHYSSLTIELDYSMCYYEGDEPSIKVGGTIIG